MKSNSNEIPAVDPPSPAVIASDAGRGQYHRGHMLETLMIVGRRRVRVFLGKIAKNSQLTEEEREHHDAIKNWSLITVTDERPLPFKLVFSFFYDDDNDLFFSNDAHSPDFVEDTKKSRPDLTHFTLKKTNGKFFVPQQDWKPFLVEQSGMRNGDVQRCAQEISQFINTTQKQVAEDLACIAAEEKEAGNVAALLDDVTLAEQATAAFWAAPTTIGLLR